MTVRGLIEAVERGEYHDRKDGTPRFTDMFDALGMPDRNVQAWPLIVSAMAKGPAATAAILRALEGGEG